MDGMKLRQRAADAGAALGRRDWGVGTGLSGAERG